MVRKNSRPYQILKYLTKGVGILLLATASPLLGPQLLKAGVNYYFKKKKFEKHRFLRDLKNLQKRDLISCRELENAQIEIKLTKQGQGKMLIYKIDDMKIQIPAHWDGKWRLVIFDIPHDYRQARDAFRKKLLNLNFYPIQKSVFITPYPCEDEIDFLTSFFNIQQYILIFYISHFKGQEKLKHHFNL